MEGTALKSIVELMEHKTVSMSMRYSHLSVDSKRQAVAKLPTFGILEASSSDERRVRIAK